MMSLKESVLEFKTAKQLAILFSVVAIGAQLLVLYFFEIPALGTVPYIKERLIYIAYCLLIMILVIALDSRFSTRWLQWVPFFIVVPSYWTIWIAQKTLSQLNTHFVPFLGFKLICLMLALAPGPMIPNALLIGGFALEAVLLWYLGQIGKSLSNLITGEPWITLLFSGCTLIILIFQYEIRKINKQIGKLLIRRKILADLAKLSILARDKINTPLQTLRICLESIRKKSKHPDPLVEVGIDSMNRISNTIHLLREFDSQIQWHENTFPDEDSVVHQLVRDLQDEDLSKQED